MWTNCIGSPCLHCSQAGMIQASSAGVVTTFRQLLVENSVVDAVSLWGSIINKSIRNSLAVLASPDSKVSGFVVGTSNTTALPAFGIRNMASYHWGVP